MSPNIPEAQRSTVQVKLRLSAETAAKLDRLAGDGERSAYVAKLIERAARRADFPAAYRKPGQRLTPRLSGR